MDARRATTVSDDIEGDLLAFTRARGPHFADVTPETDLLESGLLDSLFLMDLIFHIEEVCGIRFDGDLVTPSAFRTISRLAAQVQTQLGSAAQGAP